MLDSKIVQTLLVSIIIPFLVSLLLTLFTKSSNDIFNFQNVANHDCIYWANADHIEIRNFFKYKTWILTLGISYNVILPLLLILIPIYLFYEVFSGISTSNLWNDICIFAVVGFLYCSLVLILFHAASKRFKSGDQYKKDRYLCLIDKNTNNKLYVFSKTKDEYFLCIKSWKSFESNKYIFIPEKDLSNYIVTTGTIN